MTYPVSAIQQFAEYTISRRLYLNGNGDQFMVLSAPMGIQHMCGAVSAPVNNCGLNESQQN